MPIVRKDIILPELSYAIVGALFDVFNDLGVGLREKYYYLAIKESLEKRGLKVKQQAHYQLKYKEVLIGKLFLDFVINDKIVLELKTSGRFTKADFEQVKSYLGATSLLLGILARFSRDGATFHRVLPPLNS